MTSELAADVLKTLTQVEVAVSNLETKNRQLQDRLAATERELSQCKAGSQMLTQRLDETRAQLKEYNRINGEINDLWRRDRNRIAGLLALLAAHGIEVTSD